MDTTTPARAFIHALSTLKSDLRIGIQAALDKFSEATGGLTPAGIDVHMIEVTVFGDQLRQHKVASVDVDLGVK